MTDDQLDRIKRTGAQAVVGALVVIAGAVVAAIGAADGRVSQVDWGTTIDLAVGSALVAALTTLTSWWMNRPSSTP